MKIGLVCPYNYFKPGGVQEVIRVSYEILTKKGHSVKILTPQPRGFKGKNKKDIIFIGISTDFNDPFFSTTSQVSAARDLEQINEVFKNEQFDILHFHEPWVPVVSRQLLSRSITKNIATFHAKLPEDMISKTIEKVVTPYARSSIKYLDSLTAVSPSAAQYAKSITDREISIIPNGIELSKYKTAPEKNNKNKTILYIGRLEKRKGVKWLVKAFAEMANDQEGLALVLAGDGPEKEKLQTLCRELGVSNKTKFLGFVSENTKLKLLGSADLFCSPALYGESFGIVLLEAMASGLVTVAGNNSGYSDVLSGTGGIGLVNPKDTKAFAAKLKLLLTDVNIRSVWRKWAKTEVRKYDYEKVVGRYEELYKKVLSSQASK